MGSTSLNLITSFNALAVAIQTRIQTASDSAANGASNGAWAREITPHVEAVAQSGMLPNQMQILRRLICGEDIPLAELASVHSRLIYAQGSLQQAQQADMPDFQEGTPVSRLERVTGSTRPSYVPASIRSTPPTSSSMPRRRLTGEYVQAAIIFTDFSNFEVKSARAQYAADVSARLNYYYDELQSILYNLGGIQDKFIGDAIMGAVYQHTNNAERAVEIALAMQEAVKRINREKIEEIHRRDSFQKRLEILGKNLGDLSKEEHDQLIFEEDPLIFEMRVGVNYGRVNRTELGNPKYYSEITMIGSTVNTAARLESACPLGKVCISDSVLSQLPGGRFFTKPVGEVKVKKAAINAHVVEGINHDASAIRTQGKVRVSLQGREKEVESLEIELAAVLHQKRSRFVLLEAAPGEGKSTIADAFRKRVSQGADVIIARGDFLPEMEPYQVLAEALRNRAALKMNAPKSERERRIRTLAAEANTDSDREKELFPHLLAQFLDDPLEDPSSEMQYLLKSPNELRQQTHEMLIGLFTGLSRQRPVLLVVDDMQWVDQGSRSLIHMLLSRLKDESLMVLGLRRNEPFPEDEPNWRDGTFLANFKTLKPLGQESLEGIVREVLGDSADPQAVRLILERAGGSPLFAQETAVAFKEGMSPDRLPGTVQELFQAQLERLSDMPQALLKAAAIIGREFTENKLYGMGISEPGLFLRDLADANFVVAKPGEEGTYLFLHDLLRETVLDMMEEAEKVAMHLGYGTALETNGSHDFALMAVHFKEGGNHEKAANYYYQAGEDFVRVGEYQEASGTYEKAFMLAQDITKKYKFLTAWDNAILQIGEYTAQDRIYQLSVGVLGQFAAADPVDLAGVHLRLGRSLNKRSQYEGALKALENALRLCPETPATVKLRGAILVELGTVQVRQGDLQSGRSTYYQANAIAGVSSEDSLLLGRTLMGIMYVEGKLGNYSKVLESADVAASLFQKIGDARRAVNALTYKGTAFTILGMYTAAEEVLRKAETLSRTFGGRGFGLDALHVTLGRVLDLQGRPRDSIKQLTRYIEQNPGHMSATVNNVYLARAHLNCREIDLAKTAAMEALDISLARQNLEDEAMARMILAQCLLIQNAPNEAIQMSERAVKIFDDLGAIEEYDLEILLTHAQILKALDRMDDALNTIDRAKKLLEGRASQITNEDHRQNFLTRVEANKQIRKFWLVLRESTSGRSNKRVAGILEKLDIVPPHSLPEEVRFVMESPKEVRQIEVENMSSAGVLLDVPLATVFRALVTKSVKINKNPGELEEVWAENIRWEPFFGDDGKLYAVVDWETNSVKHLHEIVFPLIGRQANNRELLEDKIYGRDGMVFVELARSKSSSVKTESGAVVEVDSDVRPRKSQFGDLRFILVPTLDDKTILVLQMKKALYTQNPKNFLRDELGEGFIKMIYEEYRLAA